MSGAFLYALAVGFCFGAVLPFFTVVSWIVAPLLLALAVAFLALTKKYSAHAALFLACAVMCAAVVLGVARTNMAQHSRAEESVSGFAGKSVTVDGVVSEDTDARATSMRVTVAVRAVDGVPAQGVVLAVLPVGVHVSYGDTVQVRGAAEVPKSFLTNTGREFDYKNYLYAHGVDLLLSRATLLASEPDGLSLMGVLFATKHTFERALERVLPEPGAALAEGLLLGEKRGLSGDLMQAFVTSGLVHVVVLSGYNIAVVSEAALRVLAFAPAVIRFPLVGILIIFFALMGGAGAATVRAALMAIVALVARVLGRSALALRALAFATAAMVAWNPAALVYDPGFHLSVLATFGLITLSPSIERALPTFFARIPAVRAVVASTLAVQIFVLPALLYDTGVLSFVAVPANALALPVVPLAMLFSFLAGLVALVSSLAALPFVLVARALLWWLMFVARTTAALPFAAATVTTFPLALVFAAYIPLVWFAMHMHRKDEDS